MKTAAKTKPLALPKTEAELRKLLSNNRKETILEVRRTIVQHTKGMEYVTPDFIKRKLDSM